MRSNEDKYNSLLNMKERLWMAIEALVTRPGSKALILADAYSYLHVLSYPEYAESTSADLLPKLEDLNNAFDSEIDLSKRNYKKKYDHELDTSIHSIYCHPLCFCAPQKITKLIRKILDLYSSLDSFLESPCYPSLGN